MTRDHGDHGDLIYHRNDELPPHIGRLNQIDVSIREIIHAMRSERARSLSQSWEVQIPGEPALSVWVYVGLGYDDASTLLKQMCHGVAKAIEDRELELGDPDCLLFQEEAAPTCNTGLNAEDAQKSAGEGEAVPFGDYVLKLRKEKYPDAF